MDLCLNKFVLFVIIVSVACLRVCDALSLDSTCPKIFQYGIDKINDLYGEVWIFNTDSNIINLDIQVSIANQLPQGDIGRLELAFSEERIQSDIKQGKPIHYHLYFPQWDNNPPRVKRIRVNNVEVCRPGPGYEDSDLPVVSTLNIQHSYNTKASGLNNNNPSFTINKPTQNTQNTGFATRPPPTNNNQNFNEGPVGTFPFSQLSIQTERPTIAPTTYKPPKKPSSFNINPAINERNPNVGYGGQNFIPPPHQGLAYPPYDDNFSYTSQPLTNYCGRSSVGNLLVVNGDPVTKNMFPWIVALYQIERNSERFMCGGTLISRRHIITSAHCLIQNGRDLQTEEVIIALGRHNVTNRYEGIAVGPRRFFIHGEYKKTADADIAVIELLFDAPFSEAIQPICLWDERGDLENVVGHKGLVVGWGKDETSKLHSPIPKEIVIPIVAQQTCYSSNKFFQDVITPRTFCAGNRDGDGPCNGDSGSGFMMLRNGRWVIRGLVSLSVVNPTSAKQKCDLREYLLFTDVAKYGDWIYSVMTY